MNVTSPDISALNFTALFDISGAAPQVVVTNASTVVNATALNWWVVITTPNGAYIRQGTPTSLEANHVAFVSSTITTWPQPMGQIEWGKYIVTLYVEDSNTDVFSISKEVTIVRPIGSTSKVRSNFGVASMISDMRCERGELYVEDTTSYTYNGLAPAYDLQRTTVVYPLDATETQPADFVVNGVVNALVPISFSAEGYQLIRTTTATYTDANGMGVKIKYKYQKNFAVACNQDLCTIVCDYQALIAEAGETCDSATRNKLATISGLINLAMIGKTQPLCGIDVGAIIEQIKEVGGFTCECGSSSAGINSSGGINGSNSGGAFTFNVTATCGDLEVQELTQTGNNVNLKLKDKTYVFSIQPDGLSPTFSGIFSWDVSTAGCVKTIKLTTNQTALNAWLAANVPSCCPVYIPVVQKGTTTPPTACPGAYFPVDVWTPNGATKIGTATDVHMLISLLIGDNTSGGWASRGKWASASYCQAILYPDAGVSTASLRIPVSTPLTGPGGCVGNAQSYLVTPTNFCSGGAVATPLTYPLDLYVRYTSGGAKTKLSGITSYADMLAQLNGAVGKPANIAYVSDPAGSFVSVQVNDNNCTANNTVYTQIDVINEVAYGAATNGSPFTAQLQGTVAGVYAIDPRANTQLPFVPNTKTETYPWHLIKVGNFMYTVDAGGVNAGILRKIDISNPMYPVQVLTYQMPQPTSIASNPPAFGNVPLYGGTILPHFDVYFPTDLNSQVSGFLYIVESSSGSIWKYSLATDTVVASKYDVRLVGKIPRIVLGTKLYLTQDGTRETALGISAGTSPTAIHILDLTTLTGGTLTITPQTITLAGDEVWAATLNPANNFIFITTANGDLIVWDPVSFATSTYANIWQFTGPATGFINTHLFNGILYMSNAGTYGTRFLDTTNVQFATSFAPALLAGVTKNRHWNFVVPTGKCYGLVTIDNISLGGSRGLVAKYTLDGQLIAMIQNTTAGNTYNLVPLLNVPNTTPNGLLP